MAVCDSGRITEAAKQLDVAPTTVYRYIWRLEGMVNVKLLVRGTGGSLIPTDAGKLMRTHTHNVLRYLAVAMEALRSGNKLPAKRIV